jgi:hypothetical protein
LQNWCPFERGNYCAVKKRDTICVYGQMVILPQVKEDNGWGQMILPFTTTIANWLLAGPTTSCLLCTISIVLSYEAHIYVLS